MSGIKIDTGSNGNVRITQNVGDLKAGLRLGDLSRISAYQKDVGIHTGANSITLGRHGQPFSTK